MYLYMCICIYINIHVVYIYMETYIYILILKSMSPYTVPVIAPNSWNTLKKNEVALSFSPFKSISIPET